MRIILKIDGATGLVMHNERLADPLDEYVRAIKEITDKGSKQTDTDRAEVARLEWFGGLYHDTDVGVHVPSWNVIKCLNQGAIGAKTKKGKDVLRSVIATTDRVPLVFDGPLEPSKLFDLPEFRLRKMVGVNRGRVPRMRPIFRRWGLEVEVELLEDILSVDDFSRVVHFSGRVEGLCDARLLGYGRFSTEVIS